MNSYYPSDWQEGTSRHNPSPLTLRRCRTWMGEEEMSIVIGQKYVIDRNGKRQRKSVKQIYLADSSDKCSMFPVFGRFVSQRLSSTHRSLSIVVMLPALEFLCPNGRSCQPVILFPWYPKNLQREHWYEWIGECNNKTLLIPWFLDNNSNCDSQRIRLHVILG